MLEKVMKYENGVYTFVNPISNIKPRMTISGVYTAPANYYYEFSHELIIVDVIKIFQNWKVFLQYCKKSKIDYSYTLIVILGDIIDEKLNHLANKYKCYKYRYTLILEKDDFFSNILLLKLFNIIAFKGKYKILVGDAFYVEKDNNTIIISKIEEDIKISTLKKKLKFGKNINLIKVKYEISI